MLRRTIGIFSVATLCSVVSAQENGSILTLTEATPVLSTQSPAQAKPLAAASRDDVTAELVRQRFPDGKINVERWVKESKEGNLVNHGSYVEYNVNGEVVVAGSYDAGKKEGKWSRQIDGATAKELSNATLLGFAPPFVSKATFVQDRLEGDWTCADSRGNLVFVWSFKNGERHGTSTAFNAKSEVVQTINYKSNLADGPAKVSLKEGSPAEDTVFENGRMQKRIDKQYKAARGQQAVLKSQEWYLVPTPYNLASHDWESSVVTYRSIDTKDAIRHGRGITFYSNGQRESEGQYDHGKRTGTFAWWYSNGQQKTVGEYQGDKEEGSWNWWHENGMKQASGDFLAGRKTSEWSVWDEGGQLVRRTTASSTRMATKPESKTSK